MRKTPIEWAAELAEQLNRECVTLERSVSGDPPVETLYAAFDYETAAQILAEAHERLLAQRNRAWRALAAIEDGLGKMSEMSIAFFLAGAHGLDDIDEWNEVTENTEA
jgi:hypothetical protein